MVTATLVLSGIEMDESEYRETLAHSRRFEFTNGVVTAKRGPDMTQKKHWIVADEFTVAFHAYRRLHGGMSAQTPTTDFSAAADRLYRLPDVAYWAPGRAVGESIANPRTLAIEIVSPDQSVPDLREKCRFYLRHGVDVCWLVEPEQRWVEVWDSDHAGERLAPGSALSAAALPEFSLPVADLWAAIDAAPA
jgi:Uma2 family endonuclease